MWTMYILTLNEVINGHPKDLPFPSFTLSSVDYHFSPGLVHNILISTHLVLLAFTLPYCKDSELIISLSAVTHTTTGSISESVPSSGVLVTDLNVRPGYRILGNQFHLTNLFKDALTLRYCYRIGYT